MTMQNPSDPYGFGLLGMKKLPPPMNLTGMQPAPFGLLPMQRPANIDFSDASSPLRASMPMPVPRPANIGFQGNDSPLDSTASMPDPTAAVGALDPSAGGASQPGMPMLPPSMSKAGKAMALGGAPAPSMPFGSLSQMLSSFKNPFANADYSGYQAGGYDPGIGSMS